MLDIYPPQRPDEKRLVLRVEKLEEQKEVENKPPMFFDDSKPTVYGNDLEVPAFIRRQHE